MSPPRATVVERERIVAFELAHLNMREQPMGSNHTPAGVWYGMDRVAWCAMFQSWSIHQAIGRTLAPATISKGFASCYAGEQWFRRQGAWASGSVTPKRGWLIFFRWTPGDIVHHIGLVLDAGGPRNVNTIEGNTSDRVELHHRSGSTIAGYGIIDYTGSAPKPKPHVPTFHGVGPGMHGRIGDRGLGDLIGHVQNLLIWNATRYKWRDVNPGKADGDFGPKTGAAVVAFKNHIRATMLAFHQTPTFKLPVDRNVGNITYNSLVFWASA